MAELAGELKLSELESGAAARALPAQPEDADLVVGWNADRLREKCCSHLSNRATVTPERLGSEGNLRNQFGRLFSDSIGLLSDLPVRAMHPEFHSVSSVSAGLVPI